MARVARSVLTLALGSCLFSACASDGSSHSGSSGGKSGSGGAAGTSGGGGTGAAGSGSGGSTATGGMAGADSGVGGGAGAGGTGGSSGAPGTEGTIRYSEHTSPEDDAYLKDSAKWGSWYTTHTSRLVVFSPFFDDKLAWYPNAFFYQDLYAIYAGSSVLTAHPEWVLKDANGQKLFIPWGCSAGTCPQYAADIASPAFRSFWIDQVKTTLAGGYKGIWIDDVNLDFRVGDGNGKFVAPVDTKTGAAMTEDDWRKYMAEFVTEVRAAVPKAELVHNSIWYAGGASRHKHPSVQKQMLAADYLCVEGGFIDAGLTGGTGIWSASALRGYIDDVHALPRKLLLMGSAGDATELEYSLSNYFLVNGTDLLAHQANMTPATWWTGNETHLGGALGPRTSWQGLGRRDFTGGMVLVNDPGGTSISVTLPGPYKNLSGQSVTQVTLAAKRGAVLTK